MTAIAKILAVRTIGIRFFFIVQYRGGNTGFVGPFSIGGC